MIHTHEREQIADAFLALNSIGQLMPNHLSDVVAQGTGLVLLDGIALVNKLQDSGDTITQGQAGMVLHRHKEDRTKPLQTTNLQHATKLGLIVSSRHLELDETC